MTDKIPDHVTMKPVTSSQISAIGHDPQSNRLFIEFPKKTGPSSVYAYDNVDANQHAALMGEGVDGHSVGSHFINNIKKNPDAFPFTKLDMSQPEPEEHGT